MNSVKFKCQRPKCPNVPIKMYQFKNVFFYVCSQHMSEFETKHLPKLTKNNY